MRETNYSNVIESKARVFRLPGDFWSDKMEAAAEQQARTLAYSAENSNFHAGFLATYDEVTGDCPISDDYYYATLSDENIQPVKGDLARQLIELTGSSEASVGVFPQVLEANHSEWQALYDDTNATVTTAYGNLLLWPGADRPEISINAIYDIDAWLIGVPDEKVTQRILLPNGKWGVRGIDFQSGPGLIMVYEDPSTLFAGDAIWCCGFARNRCLQAYSLHIPEEVPTSGRYSMNWVRGSNGLLSLERAMAENAGVHVFTEDTVIVDRYDMPIGAMYYTTKGCVKALYPHVRWHVNREVKEGDILYDAGSINLEVDGTTLFVGLNPQLFVGAYRSRLIAFLKREVPLGVGYVFETLIIIDEIPDPGPSVEAPLWEADCGIYYNSNYLFVTSGTSGKLLRVPIATASAPAAGASLQVGGVVYEAGFLYIRTTAVEWRATPVAPVGGLPPGLTPGLQDPIFANDTDFFFRDGTVWYTTPAGLTPYVAITGGPGPTCGLYLDSNYIYICDGLGSLRKAAAANTVVPPGFSGPLVDGLLWYEDNYLYSYQGGGSWTRTALAVSPDTPPTDPDCVKDLVANTTHLYYNAPGLGWLRAPVVL